MRIHRTCLLAGSALLMLAACTSTAENSIGTSTPTSGADTTLASETTAAATTAAPTTAAPTTAAPTTAAAPPTTAAAVACAGAGGIPAGADIGTTLHGDVDGDLAADTITEYSLGGVPHVHSQLATGGQSDAEVQIGNGDHVSISFEDFDHSAGAATPPPVAVLAVGATKAGTAVYTFLTNTTHYCIEPWHVAGGQMFVGRISAEGPYEGLLCDGAAGHIFYNVTSADPAPAGGFDVTTKVMHHNFTLLTFDAPQTSHTNDPEATVQHTYGDITNCSTPPLFP
jgi:hypothetical protein